MLMHLIIFQTFTGEDVLKVEKIPSDNWNHIKYLSLWSDTDLNRT